MALWFGQGGMHSWYRHVSAYILPYHAYHSSSLESRWNYVITQLWLDAEVRYSTIQHSPFVSDYHLVRLTCPYLSNLRWHRLHHHNVKSRNHPSPHFHIADGDIQYRLYCSIPFLPFKSQLLISILLPYLFYFHIKWIKYVPYNTMPRHAMPFDPPHTTLRHNTTRCLPTWIHTNQINKIWIFNILKIPPYHLASPHLPDLNFTLPQVDQ